MEHDGILNDPFDRTSDYGAEYTALASLEEHHVAGLEGTWLPLSIPTVAVPCTATTVSS
jgi:hypothetical protein